MKKREIDDMRDEQWTQFIHSEVKGYISLKQNIIYMGEFDGKYEVVYSPNSGIRQKLYCGNSEKIANNWLNKIIGVNK